MELKNLSWDIVYRDGQDQRALGVPVEPETMIPAFTLSSRWETAGDGEVFVCEFKPAKPVVLESFRLRFDREFFLPDTIFCQGYQSWTQSREYRITERQKPLAWPGWMFNLQYYGESHFYRFLGRKGVFHGFHYGYVKSQNDQLDFIGSVNDGNGLTLLEYNARRKHVAIVKECPAAPIDKPVEIFRLFFCRGTENSVFSNWFKTRGAEPLRKLPAAGWTSWYYHYTKISEEKILKNLDCFASNRIPAEFFQIDDGYQEAVGDWLEIKGEFPRGMKHVADRIHGAGYKAGLWIAPFICEFRSKLMLEHPGWVLKDSMGRPQIAGFNPGWSGVFYALDIYNPEFRKHLADVFHTVRDEWGFDLIKLDFLYAAALNPPPHKTRGEVMKDAMDLLASVKGPALYLGCGVPMEASFGKVEFCRIGSDVAPYYEDGPLRLLQYRERVSAKNSLISTIGRRQLNGKAFLNDPDVFILRKCRLTDSQKYTLFILNNLLGGLLFTSDDLSEYTDVQMALYLSHFPLKQIEITDIAYEDYSIRAEFGIGTRKYLLFSSLGRKTQHLLLPDDRLYWRAGSLSRRGDFFTGGALVLKPCETCVFLLVEEGDLLAGDDGHIFPGSRFASVERDAPNQYRLVPDDKAPGKGRVFVRAEQGPAFVNGSECTGYRSVAGRRFGEFYL
jgi:alpha-galactosidase